MAPLPADIWTQYTTTAGSGTATSATSSGGRQYWQLFCNGRTLNYAAKALGTQPSTGYPLYIGFCGGGSDTDAVPNDNDSSWWDAFDRFYGTPVGKQSPCVFVAPRGISAYAGTNVDTYDLHSQAESFVLLQRMIMNLMLPKPTEFQSSTGTTSSTFIDPNKVYLLGFSAGGNGVFQLSTKISDRLAAVVAGGGHPEGATFENLANLPIRIQVGGDDKYSNGQAWFPRPPSNLLVDKTLSGLQTFYANTSLYVHQTDIVQGGDHASWAQPDQYDKPHPIFNKPDSFMINQVWNPSGFKTTDVTSTTIAPEPWVAKMKRNPIPSTVVWNLNSRPPQLGIKGPTPAATGKDEPYQPQVLFYWLYIRDATSADFTTMDIIHASWGKDSTKNWIKIRKPAAYLGFLINTDMADFSKNLVVYDWNNTQLGTVSLGSPSNTLMSQTLKARGDPTMVFSKMVYLQGTGGTSWTVKTADSLLPTAFAAM